MERTKSGSGMLQLSTQCRAGAASFLSPAGALASDHAARVEISAALSEGSFANWPIRGSANHGGMVFCRSEEHTSELQSRLHLVCRLLLEKKKRRQSKVPLADQADSPHTHDQLVYLRAATLSP